MSRHTDASVLPFTTHRTCTVPGCSCDRNHPSPPVATDDEGDAA
jgi:hypothetical protein